MLVGVDLPAMPFGSLGYVCDEYEELEEDYRDALDDLMNDIQIRVTYLLVLRNQLTEVKTKLDQAQKALKGLNSPENFLLLTKLD